MTIEVAQNDSKHAECTSCHQSRSPLVDVRIGFDHGFVWAAVAQLCPRCRLDLLQQLLDPSDMPAHDEAVGLTHAAIVLGVMHDVIEALRGAIGGVVTALRDNGPIDADALETLLDVTRRRLTGEYTDVAG